VKLVDASIRRPVFAVMLIASLVGLGLVSIPRLGIDLWPHIEFPMVTVQTVLTGASAETMEREVSEVLEEAVNTIEGIRSLRSASSDSLSLLFIEFELEYDIRQKAQEVRDEVAAVRSELPDDVEAPVVDRVDPEGEPILAVLLAGSYSIRSLSELADKRIKPRLERIAGVGNVTLLGSRPREIRIWLDPIRLAGYGLAVADVLAAVEREHVELPAGRIETPQLEYALSTEGRVREPAGFGAIVVAERGGRVIHLRDVASVEDGLAEARTLSRLDGTRGVALMIRRQSGENTVRVADAVKAELERIRAGLPAGYRVTVALDNSEFIRSAIRDVSIALAWGALLASLVVLLFLRNARSTLIAAIAIPPSLVGSFAFFYLFGFTINTMTLLALSLSIGLLIDDAIVVLENIYRHMERGEPPPEAGSRGAEEIGLAVITTTLAVCAVFVPIAFLSGVVGRFFREFGLVAASAVCISTLIALTLTPMLCTRFVRAGEEPGWVFRSLQASYARLERRYGRTLAWALDHRLAVAGLALAATLGGIGLGRTVPVNFVTPEDRSEFNVWLKLPLGSTLEQTQRAASAVEAELQEWPEVKALFTTIGRGAKQRVNEAQIYVQLVDKRERALGQMEIMEQIRERISGLELPLVDQAVEQIGLINITGMRRAELMYSIRGPELGQLQFFATQLVERMRRAEGYVDLYVSYEAGKPEIALDLTRQRAANLGEPAIKIASTISALYAGVDVATFEERGERYDVRVQIRPQDRDDPGKLELVRVRGADGALVPLRNLVSPRIGTGPLQIDRENRTRAITIYGNLAGKAASAAYDEIVGFAAELDISGEYDFVPVGPSQRLRETGEAINFAFVLALVAIYMILAAQFNSFVHPFVIMLSAPLSFVGAAAALWISGRPIDVMGQIAFLMLMGIVMKNGILLVDYTNTLRRRGRGVREAILEAGPTRMRPVLMTAVSTIFGMLPVAFSSGDGSEWRNPMGIIAIGGLAASTLLTLLVVPVAYAIVQDAQTLLLRGARGAAARLSRAANPRAGEPRS
jgi:HAE1 family hydrophobic/amphiphilic exporter-1